MRVDLRSDTVTKPTTAMLEAMMAAEVGDDVYGEDPTINRLEQRVAEILGKEAAIFVPSGTMANQIAIHLHTRPGDTVLCEEDSHCYLYEAGAGAALSGVQFDLLPLSNHWDAEVFASKLRADNVHSAPTTLLVVENTHNRGLGRALSADEMQRIVTLGQERGAKVHCDGARLWNAASATDCSESTLVAGLDSVAVCFSKGLGAPVGSALCGPQTFIDRARKVRKRWGGAMRQAGYLAAAALYALDHHRQRILEDHQRAERVQSMMSGWGQEGMPLSCQIPRPVTNITYFQYNGADDLRFFQHLASHGVLVGRLAHRLYRLVTHLDIDDEKLNYALDVIRQALSGD